MGYVYQMIMCSSEIFGQLKQDCGPKWQLWDTGEFSITVAQVEKKYSSEWNDSVMSILQEYLSKLC